ncbi:hypothetical protein PaG_00346 [Moesziomyces aphidis]|uniref:Uncharacterized protein n=1 Tax=Moesziomyces aphidis TaxID=84754 RepID=W3VUW5_MOEAP|nr:hypothetical protein PaG_00346 [Moesziomyces aphidis]
MATAFVATEDKTEVLTVVMQAQLLLGYVVWVSEAEFGRALEMCANAAPPPPTNAFVITAHDWKAFIGRQIEGDVARRSILPQGSEASVDDRESNEGVDAESDFDPGADFESDSGSDDSDDSDNGSDDDDDDDGDTQPDGEEVYGFDGVDLDDLDGIKQVQPGTVETCQIAELNLRKCGKSLIADDRIQHERAAANTEWRALAANDRLSGINAVIYYTGTLISNSNGPDIESQHALARRKTQS